MADSENVVAGTNATALEFNNLRKDVVLAQSVAGTESYSGTITIDWSDLTKGKVRTITLTGNPTIAFSNAVAGQFICVRLLQDGSGSRTVTWPTIKWPGGSAPPLTTTLNKMDIFLFYCPSAASYEGYFMGFNL